MDDRNSLPLDYTVIDIETTGFSREDQIIEIAALRIRDGSIDSRLERLISCDRPLPAIITTLTGITNKMLEGAPQISEAMMEFVDFIGDDILVGHNIVSFDIPFLNDAAYRELGKPIQNLCVDTLSLSKKLLPKQPRYRLQDVANALDVPYENAHRAGSDCYINFLCFEKLRQIAASEDLAIANHPQICCRNLWDGSESEETLCDEIQKILNVSGYPAPLFYSEMRSSDYLSLITPEGRDFCRIKVGIRSHWISLDMWSCPKEMKEDPRLAFVPKKTVRHWKIPLEGLEDLGKYADIILAAYCGNRERENEGSC